MTIHESTAVDDRQLGIDPAPWYWEKVNLFGDAPVEARHDFFSRAEYLHYKRGRHIFRAQDLASRVYLVHSGLVKVYHLSPDGSVTIFWFCSAGDLLGPGAVAGTSRQEINAQVVDEALVFALPQTVFNDVLKAHPQLAINLVRMVATRLRLVSDMMTDSVCLRADQRLARLLLRLARNWGSPSPGGVRLKLPISHQEIGNMIGACRQTVSRTMTTFKRQGLIDVTGRLITITNPRSLSQLGGPGSSV